MKPLVTQLWPQFTADSDFASSFSGVLVDKVEMKRNDQQVRISLQSAAPVPTQLCDRLCASLQSEFEGWDLHICNYFPFERITPDSVVSMVQELGQDGIPINGFLNHATYELNDRCLKVGVPVGKNVLESVGFPQKLRDLIEERTGTAPEV